MKTEKTDGGPLGGVEELYRDVILDHFKSPHNKGKINQPTSHADGMNPLCGDQIAVDVVIEGDVIKDIKFDGHGCAISQSAASMMTSLVKGKKISSAEEITTAFKKMFGIDGNQAFQNTKLTIDDLGDAAALEGVKKYPVRIKCALLSWNTLLESIKGQH